MPNKILNNFECYIFNSVKNTVNAILLILPKAKSGVEIESTEVALAFPLRTQEKGLAQVGHSFPVYSERRGWDIIIIEH